MKLSILTLAYLLCAGCAQTVLYDRQTGKPIARFMGDMTGSEYRDWQTSWKVATVNHSSATTAQGQAAAGVLGSIGDLGLKIGMARAMGGAVGVIKTVAK